MYTILSQKFALSTSNRVRINPPSAPNNTIIHVWMLEATPCLDGLKPKKLRPSFMSFWVYLWPLECLVFPQSVSYCSSWVETSIKGSSTSVLERFISIPKVLDLVIRSMLTGLVFVSVTWDVDLRNETIDIGSIFRLVKGGLG